jgi:hypothetical protein
MLLGCFYLASDAAAMVVVLNIFLKPPKICCDPPCVCEKLSKELASIFKMNKTLLSLQMLLPLLGEEEGTTVMK